jgi:hypothetical protein
LPTNATIQIGTKNQKNDKGEKQPHEAEYSNHSLRIIHAKLTSGRSKRTKIKTLFSIEKNPEQARQGAQNTLNPQNQKTKKQVQCPQEA